MYKSLKILLLTLLVSTSSYAQEVNLKKEKVIIDGVDVFNYTIDVAKGWMYVQDIKTNEKLIYIEESDNETKDNYEDDYTSFTFLKENIEVKVDGYGFWVDYVKFLLRNKVFDQEGTMNAEAITAFQNKYNPTPTEDSNKE